MTTRSTIVALTAALSTCVGATADLKTWSPSNGDISWHTATNWSPNGVPADGDDVQVYVPTFVTLDQDTENVRSLSISGGAYVTTFGHTLAVVDAGDALTSVTGDDTWLVVEPTGLFATSDGLHATLALP